MHLAVKACAALALAMVYLSASAVPITIEAVSAEWTNTALRNGDSADGEGTTSIRWGQPLSSGRQSGYTFNPSAPPAFDVAIGEDFELGVFTHENFTIRAPSLVSAQLDVFLDLTIGGTSLSDVGFLFSFPHRETKNACTPKPDCANDLVSIISRTAIDTFVIDSMVYSIAAIGFSQDGGLSLADTFSTAENQNNQAGLYARIAQVAEPSTLVLLGLGLLAAAFMRRWRRAVETAA